MLLSSNSPTSARDDGDEEEDEEVSDSDDDKELQRAYAAGHLKPGLNVPMGAPRKLIKNIPGLEASHSDLYLNLDWIERLDVVVTGDEKSDDQQTASVDLSLLDAADVHDDFKREMNFYKQAQCTILKALPRLHKLKIATKRPEDYFAEMVKTEDHMKRVREQLVTKKSRVEKREKIRKLRELKKKGKKIQQAVLQQRQKEKKAVLESVKKFRKGEDSEPDFLADKPHDKNAPSGSKPKRNRVREKKDRKFGFGGRKKGMKHNTSKSSSNMSSFDKKKHSPSMRNMKGNRNHKQNRPGKQRRKDMKSKSTNS